MELVFVAQAIITRVSYIFFSLYSFVSYYTKISIFFLIYFRRLLCLEGGFFVWDDRVRYVYLWGIRMRIAFFPCVCLFFAFFNDYGDNSPEVV